MNPVRKRAPVSSFGVLVYKPWYDDAGHSAGFTFRVSLVPNVSGIIALIGTTVVALLIP